jgi:hypothetical protein
LAPIRKLPTHPKRTRSSPADFCSIRALWRLRRPDVRNANLLADYCDAQLLVQSDAWNISVNRRWVTDGGLLLGDIAPAVIDLMMESPDQLRGERYYNDQDTELTAPVRVQQSCSALFFRLA